MRKGSMLAGLRPRDDESETDLDDEEAPESSAPKPKARAAPSQKGVPKPSPEETRALDLQIFSAADLLEVSLGRAPTHAEIAAKAKVPGPTDGARRQRVSVAMRRRTLLTPEAPPSLRPGDKGWSHRAPPAPVQRGQAAPVAPAPAPQMLRALVEKRDQLRREAAAFDVVIASLGGESSRECTGPELVGGVLS